MRDIRAEFEVSALVPLTRGDFAEVHAAIPGMLDPDLERCYSAAEHAARGAWLVQAHALWEADQRRRAGGGRALVADLYRAWGISQATAGNLIRVWELLESNTQVVVSDLPLPRTFYVTAIASDEPARWVRRAEEAKAADPRYTVRQLKEEIVAEKRAREAREAEERRVAERAALLAARVAADEKEATEPDASTAATILASKRVQEEERASRLRLAWADLMRHTFLAYSDATKLMREAEPDEIGHMLTPEAINNLADVVAFSEWLRAVLAAATNKPIRRIS